MNQSAVEASRGPAKGNLKEVEMRLISVLMAGAVLASCTSGPQPPPHRTVQKEQEFQQLLGGKVAGAPISCLPHYQSGDMRIIDDQTIVFRDGNRRSFLAHMQGGCNNLGQGNYALVTKQYGNADLCRGDIARVVDVLNGFTVGSCVFGDFVPYVRQGA
jgi:hypothetical protein